MAVRAPHVGGGGWQGRGTATSGARRCEGAPVDVAVGGRAGRSVVPRGSQPRQGSADNVAVVAEAPAAANRPHAVAVGQRRLTPPLRAVPPPALVRSPSLSPSSPARHPQSWSDTAEEVTLRRLAAEARQAAADEAAADGGDDEEDDDTFWGRAYGADASDGEGGEAEAGWGPNDADDDEVAEERRGNRDGGNHRPAGVVLAVAPPPPPLAASPRPPPLAFAPMPTPTPSVAAAVASAPTVAPYMPLVVAGRPFLPGVVATAAVPAHSIALPAHVQHGDTRRPPPFFPSPPSGAGPPMGRSPPLPPGVLLGLWRTGAEPVPAVWRRCRPTACRRGWLLGRVGAPDAPAVSDAWGDPFQMPLGGGSSTLGEDAGGVVDGRPAVPLSQGRGGGGRRRRWGGCRPFGRDDGARGAAGGRPGHPTRPCRFRAARGHGAAAAERRW
eukprot:TRINITY_DN2532_c0_g1_i4.p1 TRINITY_DN2532_c0_g1~~TRINITY_DN2532_c0_g1_i4.p1  ORF type:complete len:441 (-),score=44.66 TRINITY_DN2532_c0_g1_i4:46-1368(-)